MSIVHVWWFWFKKSWRVIVLNLALYVLMLPVYTFLFTLIVAALWKPKDMYEWYK